jgi:hypothetical protein
MPAPSEQRAALYRRFVSFSLSLPPLSLSLSLALFSVPLSPSPSLPGVEAVRGEGGAGGVV